MYSWAYLAFIFASVAVGSAITLRFLVRYLHEKQELATTGVLGDVKRFIEPGKLLSLRLFFALTAFSVLFILQLVFGVKRMVIALPVSIAAGYVAWRLVLAWYVRKAGKRREAFQAKVLDLTMGLANGLKSGLALGQSLDSVSKRIGEPMREEIATLLREVRFGLDYPTAFENLTRRMPGEDMHLLSTSVALTTRSGGSLAEVLDEMADTIRKRTDFHGRLKNMTEQGRYEALVISLAPVAAFAIFYLIDPVLMRPLVQTGIGWCAVGAATFLIYAGYKILRKITNVEV